MNNRFERFEKMLRLLCLAAIICNFCIACAAENTPAELVDIPTLTHMPAAQTQKPQPTIIPTPMDDANPTPAPTPSQTAEPTSSAPQKSSPQTGKSYPVEDRGFYYEPLDAQTVNRITGMSFPRKGEDCAITYDELRYVGIRYYDFKGEAHTGELIVHRKLAKEVTEIFYTLYQARYPLASVRLVDDYGEPGDDNKSMAENNSSAFNYRRVTGSKTLSRHSYGAAIDINPLYNPYIDGDRIAPPEGAAYADREQDFPGKIDHDDLCYRLFTQHGWSWGGDWKGDKDYQHFSKDIGK